MPDPTASSLVAEAKSQIENLSVDQFAKEVETGAVVVDLREPEELATSGFIPGAVHVPRGMLEFRADPTTAYYNPVFDRGARTLLYCASGGRSALGAVALERLGYSDVAHLEGGFKAWTEAGRPVARQ